MHQEIARATVLDGQVGDVSLRLVVHVEPVELMSGVDIVVAPTNVFLELPQHFKSSISAAVRRAAAIRTGASERRLTSLRSFHGGLRYGICKGWAAMAPAEERMGSEPRNQQSNGAHTRVLPALDR